MDAESHQALCSELQAAQQVRMQLIDVMPPCCWVLGAVWGGWGIVQPDHPVHDWPAGGGEITHGTLHIGGPPP